MPRMNIGVTAWPEVANADEDVWDEVHVSGAAILAGDWITTSSGQVGEGIGRTVIQSIAGANRTQLCRGCAVTPATAAGQKIQGRARGVQGGVNVLAATAADVGLVLIATAGRAGVTAAVTDHSIGHNLTIASGGNVSTVYIKA